MPSILQIGKQLTNVAGGALSLGARGAWKGATAGPMGRSAFGAAVGGTIGFLGSDYNSPTLTADAAIRGALVGAITGFGTAMAPKVARGAYRANMALGRRAFNRTMVGPRLPTGTFFSNTGTGIFSRLARRGQVGPRLPGGAFSSTDAIADRMALGMSPGASMLRGMTSGAVGAGGLAFRAGRFAFEHPLAVGAIAGGTMLAANAAGMPSSPTMSGVEMKANYNEQAMAAAELQMSGIAPMGMVGSAPQMMGEINRAMMQSTQGLVQGLHRGRH